MTNYVYVVIRDEYDQIDSGDPFRRIIDVYASEETADKVCKEKTAEEASGYEPPLAVEKRGNGYSCENGCDFVIYFYTKYEVKGE